MEIQNWCWGEWSGLWLQICFPWWDKVKFLIVLHIKQSIFSPFSHFTHTTAQQEYAEQVLFPFYIKGNRNSKKLTNWPQGHIGRYGQGQNQSFTFWNLCRHFLDTEHWETGIPHILLMNAGWCVTRKTMQVDKCPLETIKWEAGKRGTREQKRESG